MYEQGEIAVVPFPFSDLRAVKQRPVLVLSKHDYNKEAEDIITCGITSNLKDSKHSVLIENKDLKTGLLPKSSRIKVDKLFILNKSIIIKKIGKVNKRIMEIVKEEFLNLI
ncbi:type II toxin-antitoxin system PemK/MazF family toxin [Candidatus Woesearchaeota archaeon]|nr:type II toxin-antitoxin system PemK/MazF family toxin [Candidatus Woesearchaeota archaeon]